MIKNTEFLRGNLRARIAKKGLTMRQAALRSGLSYPSFHQMLNGKTKTIREDTLQKLCDTLECERSNLLANQEGCKTNDFSGESIDWKSLNESQIKGIIHEAIQNGYPVLPLFISWMRDQPEETRAQFMDNIDTYIFPAAFNQVLLNDLSRWLEKALIEGTLKKDNPLAKALFKSLLFD
jgi:DNA-binding Xre family transcriptional regulator